MVSNFDFSFFAVVIGAILQGSAQSKTSLSHEKIMPSFSKASVPYSNQQNFHYAQTPYNGFLFSN